MALGSAVPHVDCAVADKVRGRGRAGSWLSSGRVCGAAVATAVVATAAHRLRTYALTASGLQSKRAALRSASRSQPKPEVPMT